MDVLPVGVKSGFECIDGRGGDDVGWQAVPAVDRPDAVRKFRPARELALGLWSLR